MVEAQGRTGAWKGWPLVSAGWVGFPLVLFVLLATEDTAGWWRWPVAAVGFGFFACVAVGLVRLARRGGQGTGTLLLTLFAAFPVLVLLGTITPAPEERVESCQVSALRPTRELWLQQEYQVTCRSGTRDIVYRPSPRKKKSDRGQQLHAVGAKVWVSHSKGKATFVHGPGSGRLGRVLAILFIVGLLSAFGVWRALAGPLRRVPLEESHRSPRA